MRLRRAEPGEQAHPRRDALLRLPPPYVLDKFKPEIEAHAKAVADAADAAEFGSEIEAAEKAPLYLLLTSSLPTTNHPLGAAREQLPATLRIQAVTPVYPA